MKRIHWIGLILALALGASSTVQAEVTFEMIGDGMATAISADGTVIAGNTNGYEAFRWTADTGIVPLGMSSYAVLGMGAGAPDISADGTRISSTIHTADSLYVTQGLWTLGSGWQETMPPTLPDGGTMDSAYGSAWGVSGDGETVVGLYWRPGQSDGLAHGSSWTAAGGLVDLGSAGHDSRANGANHDGSVIVGWAANPGFGNWIPCVWEGGTLTLLDSGDGFAQANCVNPAGDIIGGSYYSDPDYLAVAALWHRNGANWDLQILGALPGTASNNGNVFVHDMTPDGSVAVGFNAFSFSTATGFIWTEETGMVDVADYLADNGIVVDPMFHLADVTGISDDGKTICGIGQHLVWPYNYGSFIIRIEDETAAPEFGGSGLAVSALDNPSHGPTTLALSLPRTGDAELAIFDVTGRRVRTLHHGFLPEGRSELCWDGRDAGGDAVPSGVYFYRLMSGRQEARGKLTILR